jgi:hypothetical protein
MDMGILFFNFLQRIAVGAGMVLALILIVWFSLPRRSANVVNRRTHD